MQNHNSFDDDISGTIFRDVLMLALIGFVAMVIMLLPHLSKATKTAVVSHVAGDIVVEIRWPNNMAVDVDLWVQAPFDKPVGFFNQGAKFFNLLRDDRGTEGDATDINYEVSYSRGIPAGEYLVNVHMYGPLPIGTNVPVSVVVSIREPESMLKQILNSQVMLVRQNQEETAFSFRLNKKGNLIPDSVSKIRRRIVTSRSKWAAEK